MARVIDDDSSTATALADDDSDSITVTTDNANRVHVFIDDDADTPSDHAGYELQVEVEGDIDGTVRFQKYQFIGSDTDPEDARSWDFAAIPDRMRFTLVNRSGGTADHALRGVAVID